MENRLKPIPQKDNLGCGVACLAFLLNSDYLTTLKIIKNGKYKAKNKGFLCNEIVKALKMEGKIFRCKYVSPKSRKNIYKDNSIVFIKRSKKYPAGHYLCRYKNLWMDPWINFDKNDDLKYAKAGFRKRLPGKPIYLISEK
jgi:hypothetical protein